MGDLGQRKGEQVSQVQPAPAVAPVTVVIPLYNGGRFIGETLTSIERQLLPVSEVIVIDDGSTDGGVQIAEQHPIGARVIEQAHLGVAVARNRGLAETRTAWVTFLDQDDLWHPSRSERIFAWIAAHPDEQLVATTEDAFSAAEEVGELALADPLIGSWARYHVPASGAYEALCRDAHPAGSSEVVRFDHLAMLRGPISKSTSFLARTELLRLAGGFAPHALAMDDYWLLVNASRLQPLVRIDQPTMFYRVHLSATSRSTRLALPFLTSAVALRFGGGLVESEEALEGAVGTGPLHSHLFAELLGSEEFRDPRARAVARALAVLLWPRGQRRELFRAGVRVRSGRLEPALRRVRRALVRAR